MLASSPDRAMANSFFGRRSPVAKPRKRLQSRRFGLQLTGSTSSNRLAEHSQFTTTQAALVRTGSARLVVREPGPVRSVTLGSSLITKHLVSSGRPCETARASTLLALRLSEAGRQKADCPREDGKSLVEEYLTTDFQIDWLRL
jgi:hypothetical protein